jgi:large subunit ribosomal protein L28
MAKRCQITGVGVQTGNKVSHSNRKTRRRFVPNLQAVSLLSAALGMPVKLRITVATLRTIDHNGGIDDYLLSTMNQNLTPEAVKLKRKIRKARAAAAPAVAA